METIIFAGPSTSAPQPSALRSALNTFLFPFFGVWYYGWRWLWRAYLLQRLNLSLFRLDLIPNRQCGWQIYNRRSGQFEKEREPLWHKIKVAILFGLGIFSKLLFRFFCVLDWIADHNIDQQLLNGATSRSKILEYIAYYDINMDDFQKSDPTTYRSFIEFGAREHTGTARPVHKPFNNDNAVICADSKVVAYATIKRAQQCWIKGSKFNMDNLFSDEIRGQKYDGGSMALFRMTPGDSKWCTFPVSGTIRDVRSIPGRYRGINARAIRSCFNILTESPRKCFFVDSPDFGDVFVVLIGGAKTDTIMLGPDTSNGKFVEKGRKMCHFESEDALVLLVFRKNRIVFEHDLVNRSEACIQSAVRLGDGLGVATQPAFPKLKKSSMSSKSSSSGNSSVGSSIDRKSSVTSRTPSVTFADTTNLKEPTDPAVHSKEGEATFTEALKTSTEDLQVLRREEVGPHFTEVEASLKPLQRKEKGKGKQKK